MTTYLCTVEFYQKISQSNRFKENALMVLFNWGRSRLMNEVSLIRSLILFPTEAKYQYNQGLLNSYNQLNVQIPLTVSSLRCFPVKLEIPICLAALVKKGH